MTVMAGRITRPRVRLIAIALVASVVASVSCGGRQVRQGPEARSTNGPAVAIRASRSPARDVPPPTEESPSAPSEAASHRNNSLPPAYLIWTAGGLPSSLPSRLASLEGADRLVVVAGDTAWMTRSADATGRLVDRPRPPYLIPMETFATDPDALRPFLPVALRDRVTSVLRRGEAVLGRTSAKLRRLEAGGILTFEGGIRIRIGIVVPDAVASWSEALVSDDVGDRLDVTDPRFTLLRTRGTPSEADLADRIRPLVPAGTALEVRAPGRARFRRHADLVLPQVLMKERFGEFAARPDPANPGYLDMDPAFVREHLDTVNVPLLGATTCNVAVLPALTAAMRALRMAGLATLIHGYAGCYAARTVLRAPRASISHHSWGGAVDINAAENPFGSPPTQDRRLVNIMARAGFSWGGVWFIPDGMHFELDPDGIGIM